MAVKVLVFGASGIVGQHMGIGPIPAKVDPVFLRHANCDITDADALLSCLNGHMPDAVVNLAGESNVDAVERDPAKYRTVNVIAPRSIAEWCEVHHKRYVHVSTQAVFSGNQAPYYPRSARRPVNEYGRQKMNAEDLVYGMGAAIVRLSFVLGIRPDQTAGRINPLEAMLTGQTKQVCDRWFSPLFSSDAAAALWDAALEAKPEDIWHCGVPERASRADVARAIGMQVEEVRHADFPGIAERPIDTTYGRVTRFKLTLEDLKGLVHDSRTR